MRDILLFYRRAPKILHRGAKLPWRVLRTLASIEDETAREEFALRAMDEKWTAEKLRSKIKVELRSGKNVNDTKDPGRAGRGSRAVLSEFEDPAPYGRSEAGSQPPPPDHTPITRPKLGTLYTYRLVRTAEDVLKLDLGFSVYRTEFDAKARLKEGDIAESLRAGDGTYEAVKSARTPEDLFTYKAWVERVIDGDTLFVEIDLGFTNTTRQYLRLRALDSPELGTAEGRKAREFTAAAVKRAPFLFITSTRSDKYDRYLADVFIPGREFLKAWAAGKAVLSTSEDLLYLNNALLEHRLAVRMKG